MRIFTMSAATSGRAFTAALTRTASGYASTAKAPVCPETGDLARNKAHSVQAGPPPRGSEALL